MTLGRVAFALGMMVANILAVSIGDRIADNLSVKTTRVTAAIIFTDIGIRALAALRG